LLLEAEAVESLKSVALAVTGLVVEVLVDILLELPPLMVPRHTP
jgi:hypothetical protein